MSFAQRCGMSSQWLRNIICHPIKSTSNTIAASRTPTTAAISKLARHTNAFSTSSSLAARDKGNRVKRDMRIVLIRYHLSHPITPRPLRFSRLRALRHWTIHRAWQLHKRRARRAQELEMERQYESMRAACEALRLIGEEGLSVAPDAPMPKALAQSKQITQTDVRMATASQKDVGRLYRIAMEKKGIWAGVPIEYAKCQTDTPSRTGWDHEWTR